MVAFSGAVRSMGEDAASTFTSNFKNTITSMKRLIGLQFDDARAQTELARVPFKSKKNPANGGVLIDVMYENVTTEVTIEQATAMMLSHMSGIAQAANSNVAPQDWVIAVPSYYSDAQKRSFLDACDIAGVNCQRLMHETTASALAYGIFKDIKKEFKPDEPTYTMFIDLGTSSFQVSVVSYTPKKLKVLSTHFDATLGGRDFDLVIAEWSTTQFENKYKNVDSPKSRPKSWLKLLIAAEKAKKTLSPNGVKEAKISVECLVDETDFNASLTTPIFEEICAGLLGRLEAPIQRALKESKIDAASLDSVELIGGGTRVSCVKRTLAKILNLDSSLVNNGLKTTMNADEAVSRGCALQSAILSPRFKVLPYEIVEQQLHPVRVTWEGEAEADDAEAEEGDKEGSTAAEGADANASSVVMFERGSNFPLVRRVTLKKSGQFTINVHYDAPGADSVLPEGSPLDLATFTIDAPTSDAPNKIRVNVKQDVSGIITLSSAQSMEEVPVEETKVEETKDEEMKDAGSEAGSESKEGDAAAEGADAATPPEPKAEEVVVPKKKYKKTNLTFTVASAMKLKKEDLDKIIEVEARMANADRVAAETAAMRNELESYLYSMRDRIIGDLKDYATEGEQKEFSSALEKMEDWMYSDEGFENTKSVFSDKLAEVQKFGSPIENRMKETDARQAQINTLKGSIETYKSFVGSADAKYEHITDEERGGCREAVTAAEAWLYDQIEKQSNCAQSVDPVLTVAMIQAKQKELSVKVSPIMHKVKPIPKKVEETKKDEETKMDTEETKEGGGEEKTDDTKEAEPMDTEATEPSADGADVAMDVE